MQRPPDPCGGEPIPNAEQADNWNGDHGRHWVEYRERYDQIMHRLTPHLLDAAGITADHQVLDIGCGAGQTTCLAARSAHNGQALGVDLSGPMLEEARHRAARDGASNARFEQGDAQVHPFPPAGYDVADPGAPRWCRLRGRLDRSARRVDAVG